MGLFVAVLAAAAGNWVGHMGVWFSLLPTAVISGVMLYVGNRLYRLGLRMNDQLETPHQGGPNAT
jgi:hypothetical protein